ncbi:PEP-CTERM sorting domain-containing protein [archaeon]|jgi:hypothetical protein|nr:PEP-CTERM sorting domain-containing protein [Candidatus Woesearchaeota archaeon]MBT4135864.1 PEP-CTERM sorting domain-containing protein [archaeon]MBT4242224.1 PEP-CTERM sorting domain-containing protein [archaeon]MBT4417912.1 PEP-CTERM sorting domain-containing protein [archaeon]
MKTLKKLIAPVIISAGLLSCSAGCGLINGNSKDNPRNLKPIGTTQQQKYRDMHNNTTPEPSTALLLTMGVGALGAYRLGRNNRQRDYSN